MLKIKTNLDYCYQLTSKNQFVKAAQILLRLKNDIELISEADLIYIMKIMYQAGFYKDGLEIANSKEISVFEYWYYKAKLANILTKKELAYSCIKTCKKYATTISELTLCDSFKITIFLEMKDKLKEAKKIFYTYYEKNTNLNKLTLEDLNIFKEAESFLSMPKAKLLLSQSYNEALQYHDFYLQAIFSHNLGVVLFRLEEYKEARKNFLIALKINNQYKPHEKSYTLNDLAVLEIINYNFEKAIDLLEEGIFWNKSLYTKLALLCNLAICKAMMRIYDDATKLIEEIFEIVANEKLEFQDILRKINTNAAFIYFLIGDTKKSKQHILYINDYVVGTSSQYRLNLLMEKIPEIRHFIKPCEPPKSKYEKFPFDCWIVTLSHD